MYDAYHSERRRKWVVRAVAAVLGGALVYWALAKLETQPHLLFAIAGVAIAGVYVLDVPQLLFTAIEAAGHKVAGVEHDGRHEWYGFKGHRVRVFLDDGGAPWFAAKEIAHLLELGNVEHALRHLSPTEAAAPASSKGEKCLSEAGLRRLLAHSRHAEAGPLRIWLEREVLLPLRQRESR